LKQEEVAFIRARLRTPRAAAIAGIVFSILFMVALGLIRISVPADPHEAGAWLPGRGKTVNLALQLVPFAGIAFLWFIGVLRDRIGAYEDRFFATVFLGSGILFLVMLFAASAVAGGIMMVYGTTPDKPMESGVYSFGRAVAYQILNVYALKMAGVFMISTVTLSIRTGMIPRWMALLGYPLALLLLLSSGLFGWVALVFPLWVFLVSAYILLSNLRGSGSGSMMDPIKRD